MALVLATRVRSRRHRLSGARHSRATTPTWSVVRSAANVLDAMRAARQLEPAELPQGGPAAIMGYSEGGTAAAWAAQLQPNYAPELELAGVAAGAAAADIELAGPTLDGSFFSFFLAYGAIGFAAAYPELELEPYLVGRARETIAALRHTNILQAAVRGPRFARAGELTDPNVLELPELARAPAGEPARQRSRPRRRCCSTTPATTRSWRSSTASSCSRIGSSSASMPACTSRAAASTTSAGRSQARRSRSTGSPAARAGAAAGRQRRAVAAGSAVVRRVTPPDRGMSRGPFVPEPARMRRVGAMAYSTSIPGAGQPDARDARHRSRVHDLICCSSRSRSSARTRSCAWMTAPRYAQPAIFCASLAGWAALGRPIAGRVHGRPLARRARRARRRWCADRARRA